MPRLDIWLVEKGKFSSRQAAKRAIKEGYVKINGVIAKASKQVDGTEDIMISEDAVDSPQGYSKLKEIDSILDRELVHQDDMVLDIGSSAGGFMQYLIERGASVIGIEISEEFLPQLSEIVRSNENASLIIADAFEIDLDIIYEECKLDLLVIDVTTVPDGTLALVKRFTQLLKESGLLVCAFKSRPAEDITAMVINNLQEKFEILHVIELDVSRQEFHVVASRR